MNREIKNVLQSNPAGVFITNANGQIKARVFQYLFAEDNKVFFAPAARKMFTSK